MAIYLKNRDPQPGATNILVDTSIQLTVDDTIHSVVLSSVLIWVDEVLAYRGSEGFQTGFSGTVAVSGNGYVFDISPDSIRYGTNIEVVIEANSSGGEKFRGIYSFETIINLYYNIYLATSANHPLQVANSTPILHSVNGNEYTISGLAENTPYYITIVPGKMENSQFVPLISQPVGVESRGALEIDGIKVHDRLLIKTFTP